MVVLVKVRQLIIIGNGNCQDKSRSLILLHRVVLETSRIIVRYKYKIGIEDKLKSCLLRFLIGIAGSAWSRGIRVAICWVRSWGVTTWSRRITGISRRSCLLIRTTAHNVSSKPNLSGRIGSPSWRISGLSGRITFLRRVWTRRISSRLSRWITTSLGWRIAICWRIISWLVPSRLTSRWIISSRSRNWCKSRIWRRRFGCIDKPGRWWL